ncbi:MAG: hypothetical protein K0R28_7121 [Paenibacillus sp.]|nr:hypothetical protein [Paenibacillus sp.]
MGKRRRKASPSCSGCLTYWRNETELGRSSSENGSATGKTIGRRGSVLLRKGRSPEHGIKFRTSSIAPDHSLPNVHPRNRF